MTESKKPMRENRWTVEYVRCMDCGAEFKPGFVDRDVKRPVGSGNRILLVVMPEVCPKCHNLKSADD